MGDTKDGGNGARLLHLPAPWRIIGAVGICQGFDREPPMDTSDD